VVVLRKRLRRGHARGIHPVNLKDILRQVQADHASLHRGRLPLLVFSKPPVLAHSMPRGGRPLHHCEEQRDEARHCEERSDEAIQQSDRAFFWIASLRSQ
jgi:hypothetical protein